MSRITKSLVAGLSAALIASTAVVTGLMAPQAAAAPQTEQDALVLRYTAPAPLNRWQEEALPIGNGALGASIFGQVTNDEVFLNEKTLWTGGPGVDGYRYGNYPESEIEQRRANLEQVRDTINENGSMTAGAVANLLGQPKLGYGSYQSFGRLQFAFDNGAGTATGYERSLDIDNSIAKVTYTVGQTTFTREYFASYPDNVIVSGALRPMPGSARGAAGGHDQDPPRCGWSAVCVASGWQPRRRSDQVISIEHSHSQRNASQSDDGGDPGRFRGSLGHARQRRRHADDHRQWRHRLIDATGPHPTSAPDACRSGRP